MDTCLRNKNSVLAVDLHQKDNKDLRSIPNTPDRRSAPVALLWDWGQGEG